MAANPGSSQPASQQQKQQQLSPIDDAKRRAAYRAVADHLSADARYVGIGSGSTVVYVVEAIARLGPAATARMVFIPTGFQSRELIVRAGLRLGTIDALVPVDNVGGGGSSSDTGDNNDNNSDNDDGSGAVARPVMLDVAFDGADEVDDELNCIKGGGACLFQEKLVATSARKFICVAGRET
jgi:ribose 5-phosphate isomerase A